MTFVWIPFLNVRLYEKEVNHFVALPLVPFNQSKLSDVCQYLDYLQNFLRSLPLPEVLILLLND